MGCSEGTNKSLEPNVPLLSAGLLLFPSHARLSTKGRLEMLSEGDGDTTCGGFHQSEQMEKHAEQVQTAVTSCTADHQYRNKFPADTLLILQHK